LFHTIDKKHEIDFDFNNKPKKFIDIETGDTINLYAEQVQENYKKSVNSYFNNLKMKCLQYKIDYVPVDINKGFEQVLISYLIGRKHFL